MVNEPLISVVLATYNGSKYLHEQLTSIYSQTYKNIEVIVCDDISTDATVDILKEYQEKYNLRYYVNATKQGVIKNFETALSYAKGDYIALSDQDDVWIPNKLELSFKELINVEKRVDKHKPVLTFSDLTIVDESLTPISPSYWNFMGLNPRNTQLNRVLVENVITGCTVLMNRATLNLALPIPEAALMHDVWFLLVATCFGYTACVQDKTVLYRQHNQNVVGARQTTLQQKLLKGLDKLVENKISLLQPEIEQGKAFYNQFYQHLLDTPEKREILEAFIHLKNESFLNRKKQILKYAFYGSSLKKAINVLLRG